MSSTQSWTQTIDTMFTSTWAYRQNQAIEQVYSKTPFWFWLKEKNRIKEIRGYRRIEIPVEYGKNETVAWITKGSTVPLTETELLTMAYEDWKYVTVTMLRFGTEDQQNRGKARIIDYVERKENAAERALNEEFERVVFADGTGSNEPNGLQNLVSVTPTTGTVHGINRATSTNSWWRNLQKTSSGVTSVHLISDMRYCLNTMTTYTKIELNDIFMLTTQTIFEALEDELLDYRRFVNTKMVDLGIDNITYKGRPVMWAPSAPSGNMYFINPAYLYCVIDPDYFMDMTEWKVIPDQVNDRVAQIICTLQMIITRPISQMVMSSIEVG